MSLRWLLIVPMFVAIAAGVMLLGPYAELSAKAVPFDELPARSIDDAIARIEKLGPDGIALYRAHLRWDALFIVANVGIFGTPTLVLAGRLRVPRRRTIAMLAPAITFAACDLIENALIATALGRAHSPTEALTAAAFTTGKHLCFVIAGVVTLATALYLTTHTLRYRLRTCTPTTARA